MEYNKLNQALQMFHLAIDQAAVKEYSDMNGHIHSV